MGGIGNLRRTLRLSAALPWNKRKDRQSLWKLAPQEGGLLISWLVDAQPISPQAEAPTGIPEAHRTLFDHLQELVRERFVIQGAPILTPTSDGFLLSTAAVYAGARRDESNEASSACRGIYEWLPFALGTRPPDELPVTLDVQAQGDFASTNFSVRTSVAPEVARGREYREVGPFLEYTDGHIELLPKEAYEVLQELRQPWPRPPLERLRRWAMIKPKVLQAEARLDRYLAGEDAVIVDKIRPIPTRYEDGSLHVEPGTTDPVERDFAPVTEKFVEPQPQYNVQDTTRSDRKRFILTPEAEEALGTLKQQRELRGSDAVRSLTAAEELFSGPGFDLEDYSDRVIGVGVYVYRALPYLGTPGEKRDWFAWDGAEGELPEFGMSLESDLDDSKDFKLSLTDPEKREELRQKIQQAEEHDDPFVEVAPGSFVPRAEARKLVEQAEALSEAKAPEQRQKLVFQIYENIERREYSTEKFSHVSRRVLLPTPPTLAPDCQLLEHQISGYSWLCAQAGKDGPGAALLADEMGLGKTLQVLCMLAERRRNGLGKPVLIVAPISLLENWQREADRFFPGVFTKRTILSNRPLTSAHDMVNADLVLSSYETLRGASQFEAGKVNWDTLVLDEAQRIKNPTTQTSIAIKGLKAEFRVAMTATPVENSLAELWNIVDFLLPGYLASLREFHREHILAWQRGSEQDRDTISQHLIQKLQPILLRRMKHEVLDLPEKCLAPVHLPMSPLQEKLYSEVIRQLRAKEIHALAAVRQLLYACAHPGLLDPAYASETCPKLEFTVQTLEAIQQVREKALIFTGSLQLQTLLRRTLEKRFGVPIEIVNGSTPAQGRQSTIDRFSARPGFGVLLLSPRAAGLGLNITAATHVIHYTRDWNPAIEAQSTDRTHRIGQTKTVTVHFPIVSGGVLGSAEQKLDELLREKSILASSIVRPTSDQEVSADEIIARILQ